MWDLAVREDDYDAVDAMLRRYGNAPLSMRLVPAFARGDTTAMRALREEARALDARQSQIAARYVATFLEDFASAEDLAQYDLAPRRNLGIRTSAQLFLAWLDVARGRWQSARSGFAAAERLDGGAESRSQRAQAATLPFLDIPAEDLHAIRRDLEQWDPRRSAASAGRSLATELQPHLRSYLLSLLSSKLGDDERALRHARELQQLPAPAGAEKVIAGLTATALGDVALRNGRAEEALSLLADADGQVPLELVFVKPFAPAREYTQEHARFLRAEALASLGRHEEALRWLEMSFQGSAPELVYLAPVLQRRAVIHEMRGDTARAIEHHQRFSRLWAQSDPAMQPAVQRAREAISRLSRP